jgi:CelD/BcsL family acetyltransferase involved in cellulose biosynthesis
MESLLNDASQQDSPVREGGLTRGIKHSLARVYEVDPLRDRRWQSLVEQHPHASVYHTVEWLRALHRTYKYEPVAFTDSPPTSDLKRAMLFCGIRSWLTGRRVVSLPFSDYCTPLCDGGSDFGSLIVPLQATRVNRRWKYLEIRPASGEFDGTAEKLGFGTVGKYILHCLDLEPSAEEIFRRLHKDSVQRRVRHAERVGVVELSEKSPRFLKDFYQLLVRTRARHNLPPQPYAWFRNLVDGMGSALDLRIAYMEQIPVAAVLILHFKDKSYYKYGCSDERFHHLGSIPFLLWRAILNAKSIGSRTFDLGRTAVDQHGLLEFKKHWAPVSGSSTYWKFPPGPSLSSSLGWNLNFVKSVCAYVPTRLLRIAGTALYRHIG